jgi:3-phenylpropionate/cinnamic acid dioxygenase small subunit
MGEGWLFQKEKEKENENTQELVFLIERRVQQLEQRISTLETKWTETEESSQRIFHRCAPLEARCRGLEQRMDIFLREREDIDHCERLEDGIIVISDSV